MRRAVSKDRGLALKCFETSLRFAQSLLSTNGGGRVNVNRGTRAGIFTVKGLNRHRIKLLTKRPALA